jgi:hypothetical protein
VSAYHTANAPGAIDNKSTYFITHIHHVPFCLIIYRIEIILAWGRGQKQVDPDLFASDLASEVFYSL